MKRPGKRTRGVGKPDSAPRQRKRAAAGSEEHCRAAHLAGRARADDRAGGCELLRGTRLRRPDAEIGPAPGDYPAVALSVLPRQGRADRSGLSEVFLDPWNPQWQAWIVDRSRPLLERLTCFYQDYARVILRCEGVRLFMFSGLRGLDIAKRYFDVVFARIFPSVIGEVRSAQGGLPLAASPMTDAEVEHLWALHGSIFLLGIRRWIYRLPVPADQDAAIAARVVAFLDGAPGVMRAAASSAKGWSLRVEALTPQH